MGPENPAPTGDRTPFLQPTRNMKCAHINLHLRLLLSQVNFNSEGNFRPRTGHKSPEVE